MNPYIAEKMACITISDHVIQTAGSLNRRIGNACCTATRTISYLYLFKMLEGTINYRSKKYCHRNSLPNRKHNHMSPWARNNQKSRRESIRKHTPTSIHSLYIILPFKNQTNQSIAHRMCYFFLQPGRKLTIICHHFAKMIKIMFIGLQSVISSPFFREMTCEMKWFRSVDQETLELYKGVLESLLNGSIYT
jgi:hypothetical protein